MISREELLERVRKIAVWKRRGERAPHKPLLMLFALGRLVSEAERLVEYRHVDEALGELLREFGPPRKSVYPEYPFWRLQRDELWVVKDAELLGSRKGNTDPPRRELLARGIRGGFPPGVQETLEEDSDLRRIVAQELLQEHFPESLHEELLSAVGLPTEWARAELVSKRRRKRSPKFRPEVLEAYGWACAVCGFDVRIAQRTFGLDAAHVRWHQADGPDEVSNGVALCVLHHRALDRGVIGLDEELTLLVSSKAAGAQGFDEAFLAYMGLPLRAPHTTALGVDPVHAKWHRREVFQGPPRGA